jgi:predicted metal-binding membrane protein
MLVLWCFASLLLVWCVASLLLYGAIALRALIARCFQCLQSPRKFASIFTLHIASLYATNTCPLALRSAKPALFPEQSYAYGSFYINKG